MTLRTPATNPPIICYWDDLVQMPSTGHPEGEVGTSCMRGSEDMPSGVQHIRSRIKRHFCDIVMVQAWATPELSRNLMQRTYHQIEPLRENRPAQIRTSLVLAESFHTLG